MTTGCTIDPTCEWGPHDPAAHPCGIPARPGDPCRRCGAPQEVTAGTVQPCPACWTPIDIPAFRALMAAEGLDTVVTQTGETDR